MKKQDSSKRMLFEAMHKVTGMPLNEDYQDYLDTNYSADGMDDYNALKEIEQQTEALYDAGKNLYLQGRKQEAEEKRQEALKKGHYLDWGETELPPYGESEINENLKNYLPDELKDLKDANIIMAKIIELLDLLNDPNIDQSEGGISDKMREMALHMINTNR